MSLLSIVVRLSASIRLLPATAQDAKDVQQTVTSGSIQVLYLRTGIFGSEANQIQPMCLTEVCSDVGLTKSTSTIQF